MQTNRYSAGELLNLSDWTFVVPVYQRNYSWKKANCERLFDDLIIAVKDKKDHFIGTICCKHENKFRFIIDGQQRISSIILLLKAIHDLTDNQKLKDNIYKNYFLNFGYDYDDNGEIKLILNQKDRQVWKDMIAGKEIDEKSTLYDNYLLFCKLVEQYQNSGGHIPELFDGIRNYLRLVELVIEDENPQEIFESFNSTGIDLTDVDLLRNYFLMPFDHTKQEHLYQYWSEIEDNIPDAEMTSFFMDYLIYKRKSPDIMLDNSKKKISGSNLYHSYKSMYNILSYETIERLFKDLVYCSRLYKKMLFEKEALLTPLDDLERKLYLLFKTLSSTAARSLGLYLLVEQKEGRISKDQLLEALDIIIDMNTRAKIAPYKFVGVNKQTAGNMIGRLDASNDDFIETFWREITTGHGQYAFPVDEEFLEGLMQPGFNKDLAKFLLTSFELNSKYSKELADMDATTLEHIMPKSLSKWKKTLTSESMSNYSENLNKLGNLALTKLNSEMSNEPFETKRKFYKESNFRLTRKLAEYSDWQSQQIEERTKKLANLALTVFPLPEKYIRKENSHLNSIHDLPERFTSREILTAFIDDEEVKVNKWSKLLTEICKIAVRKDERKFIDLQENTPMLQPKKQRTATLNNRVKINVNLSTADCLRLSEIVANAFNLNVMFIAR